MFNISLLMEGRKGGRVRKSHSSPSSPYHPYPAGSSNMASEYRKIKTKTKKQARQT